MGQIRQADVDGVCGFLGSICLKNILLLEHSPTSMALERHVSRLSVYKHTCLCLAFFAQMEPGITRRPKSRQAKTLISMQMNMPKMARIRFHVIKMP